jgi:hypothetical protein
MIDRETQEELERLWIEVRRLRERIGVLEDNTNPTPVTTNQLYPIVQAPSSPPSEHVIFPENFFEEPRFIGSIMEPSPSGDNIPRIIER